MTSSIFSELDKGQICVFPSEIIARFYAELYARESDRAMILSSQTMAWDKFKAQFYEIKENQKPVTPFIRKLFTQSFVDNKDLSSKLEYYKLSNFDGSESKLVSYLSTILVELKMAAKDLSGKNPALEHDISFIYQNYCEFLNDYDLYEPDYLPLINEKSLENYTICFASAIGDLEVFFRRMEGMKGIKVLSEPSVVNKELEKFNNSLVELRVCYRRIRKLLEQGVSTKDICITALGLEKMQPYLIREAKRYEVPISIVSGTSPSDFFLKLSALLQNYQLTLFASIVLNPSYPFRDRDVFRNIFYKANSSRVVSGKSSIMAALGDPECPEAKLFYTFTKALERFNRCTNVEDLRSAINGFQDDLFEPEAFRNAKDEAKNKYSFCLRKLDEMKQEMDLCQIKNLPDFFNFYVNYLEKTTYVSKTDSTSIKVYSYPNTVGMCPKYHFVLGISQETAQRKARYFTLLSDSDADLYADVKFSKNVDATSDVLKLYSYSGKNIYLSGSDTDFSGATLTPALFLSNKKIKTYDGSDSSDSYKDELNFWARDIEDFTPVIAQKRSFEAFCKQADVNKTKYEYKIEDSTFNLSAYQIDNFFKCPFLWLSSSVLKVGHQEINMPFFDSRDKGNILHQCMQNFFSQIGYVDVNKLESYQALLLEIFEKVYEDFTYKKQYPQTTYIYQRGELWGILQNLFDEKAIEFWQALDGFKSTGDEIASNYQFDDVIVNGRIDQLLKNVNGDVFVIDYKSAELKKNTIKVEAYDKHTDSVQLHIYNEFVKKTSGQFATLAAFFSFKDNKLYFAWENQETAQIASSNLALRIFDMINKVKVGDFTPSNKTDNCKYCDYDCVCRQKFLVY